MTDALDDEPALPDAGSRGLAERVVTRMDLERALAQLPEGCRTAFVLHDVQGLEHREVGEIMGIAEGHVEVSGSQGAHAAAHAARALTRWP